MGVARQYCGQLGKQDNCQVAVSLSVANDHASLPIAYQLFLPEVWARDPARRAKAGVPETIRFETKTAIALGQLREALAAGVPDDVRFQTKPEIRIAAGAPGPGGWRAAGRGADGPGLW